MTVWALPLGPQRAQWAKRPLAEEEPCSPRVLTLAMALCTPGLCLFLLGGPSQSQQGPGRDEKGVEQRAEQVERKKGMKPSEARGVEREEG